ncbi:MAG: hypothetical protein AAGH99_05020 [Planctomycetota bacterium]
MNIKQVARGLVVAAVACTASSSFADFAGVGTPFFRGDTGTGFIQFDEFTPGAGPGLVSGSVATASGGGLTGNVTQANILTPPAALIPAGSGDNRLYVHTSAVAWTISLTAADEVSIVKLQVKEEAGSGIASLGVLLEGETATNVGVRSVAGDAITTYLWRLANPIATSQSFDITINSGPFTFDSYDSFTVDVIPEPVSASLIGFGSLLLLSRRRR